MKGRDQAQQQSAYQVNRLLQGYGYAYNAAKDQYLGMLQNDPDLAAKLGELNQIGSTKNPTPEQQARAKEIQSDPKVGKAMQVSGAADAAWAAQQKIYGNYINPQKKSKTSKGGDQSSKASGDGENPIELLQSKNPQDKARGYWLLNQKIGPGYKREAAYYMSPQYQQAVRNAQGEQQITTDVQAKRLELHKLQNADLSTLDDKQKQRLTQLQDDPELFPQLARQAPRYSTFDTPGSSLVDKTDPRTGLPLRDKFGQPFDPSKNYRQETVGNESVWIESAPKASTLAKPGSEQEFIERVAKESGIPEKELSADSLLALRHAFAQSNQVGRISHGSYFYTNKETGEIVEVPVTRSTGPQGAAKVPAVTSGSAGTPAGTATVPTSKPSTSTAAASSTSPSAGGPGHVVGHTLSQPHAKSQQTTNDTYKKMKPLFGLLSAQEEYMKEIESDPSKATPRQDLSLIVAAVRSMNPGSVRLPTKELELEMKAGSYGDRIRRWYEIASNGTLPDDQRKDLFTIVQRETTKAGESIAADWQQYMSGQPLPSDLKRFAKSGGGGGSTPQGASDEVYAADGSTLIGHIVDGRYVPLPKQQ